jgi:hypothetical protein
VWKVFVAFFPSSKQNLNSHMLTASLPSSTKAIMTDWIRRRLYFTGHSLSQVLQLYSKGEMIQQTIPGLAKLWHAAFPAVPIFLFLFPTSVCILWRKYVYIHISDCVQTVYELPLLPYYTAVKHFYTNREQCEVLTGYLSLGRRPGSDWAVTSDRTFTVFVSNRKQQQSQLLPYVLAYCILREGFYYKHNNYTMH